MPQFFGNRRVSNQRADKQLQEQQIRLLRKQNREMDEERSSDSREKTQGLGLAILKKIKQGFGDVARSLNTPNTNRRPRISQMPARRKDMDIVRKADLKSLKPVFWRNRDIRGKKINYGRQKSGR